MRRHDSGAGCGGRANASQAFVRYAPGSRPPQLRGAALQWARRRWMKAGESLPDQGAPMRPPPAEATVPGCKIAAGGAPRGGRPASWDARRKAKTVGCALRRSAPSHGGGKGRGVPRRLSRGAMTHACANGWPASGRMRSPPGHGRTDEMNGSSISTRA